uniref:Uncharacterized protein n=1 Tax=Arundo donax TaxID=35708 RepID=A0A0A9A747_ARUDO
MNTRESKQLM